MRRLLVHVEGQTEEGFVNLVLSQHLVVEHGFSSVKARLLGNARLRSRRHGIVSWRAARDDIASHLKEDRHCIATTMVDYYALPARGEAAWPGRDAPLGLSTAEKAQRVEEALLADIAQYLGPNFDRRRFVPYVAMHEFEAMMFSDCSAFASAIGKPELSAQLETIRDAFETVEDINDSAETAPSKRIRNLWPGYDKVAFGSNATAKIGLQRIREQCPNFHRWIGRLRGNLP